ncbi:MAG TPA: hypothetical protein VFE08_13235 [Candidatus Sulfotelmatobacter sp.]|jgi:hypothetical protein|nr:hypothetical protein [Candidatus Sulfotelmatobacter sp.]
MKRLGLFLGFLFMILPAHGQQDQPSPQTVPATSLPDLKPDAHGALSQEQMQQLFRAVAEKDLENDKQLRNYTYVEREEEHKLDGQGQVKSTEAKTYEVMELYGEQVQRLIEKNDKPLDAKAAAKEEEKVQKVVDKRKNESEDARRKRDHKEEKDREDGRKFVLEVADAYNFHLVGTESVGGREAWVIDAEPRPGYEPHMKEAKFLPKFHGRVWIDKDAEQLSKLDVECIDTVSLGWFLARVHKGSRIVFEQTRVNDEVWLPKHIAMKVDVRLALLKEFRVNMEQTYRDYKKFRATARIVGVGNVQEQ